jgi:uncharacterized protein with HEPN domain
MKLDTAKRLRDAADACKERDFFSSPLTRERFLSDRGSQLILWKLVEIVGEALLQAELPEPELSLRLPELRDVVNTRNRITHGYDTVNYSYLWDIVEVDIPQLLISIEILLEDAPNIDDDPLAR